MPDRRRAEQRVRVADELRRLDVHLVHEAAAELRGGRQPAERRLPLGAVRVEERSLLALQLREGGTVFGPLRQRELHADESPTRVALLVEPVGKDQPLRVVIGVRADPLEERLRVGVHGQSHMCEPFQSSTTCRCTANTGHAIRTATFFDCAYPN